MKSVQNPIATEQSITEWLVQWIANALGVDPCEIEADKSLLNYSLSSVTAMMLVGDLEELLGLTLPPTLVWDFPTIVAIADYLDEQVRPPVAAEPDAVDSTLKSSGHLVGPVIGATPAFSIEDMSDQEVTALLDQLLTEGSAQPAL